jgi:O-antigen ligase
MKIFNRATWPFALMGLVSAINDWLHPYGGRSFALGALIALAVLLPRQSTGLPTRVMPYLIAALAIGSLSRTASVICVAMLAAPAARQGRRRLLKSVAMSLGAVAALILLIDRYPPFRDRFLQGDNGYAVGGVKLNTSGRVTLWRMVVADVRDNWLAGNGPGSSVELISSHFAHISHPHNDYLRIYHDFGLVGLTLFTLGYAMLIARTARRAILLSSGVHSSALMGLIAISAAMLTDNVVIYGFVMVPLAVLVGLSMAYSTSERT